MHVFFPGAAPASAAVFAGDCAVTFGRDRMEADSEVRP